MKTLSTSKTDILSISDMVAPVALQTTTHEEPSRPKFRCAHFILQGGSLDLGPGTDVINVDKKFSQGVKIQCASKKITKKSKETTKKLAKNCKNGDDWTNGQAAKKITLRNEANNQVLFVMTAMDDYAQPEIVFNDLTSNPTSMVSLPSICQLLSSESLSNLPPVTKIPSSKALPKKQSIRTKAIKKEAQEVRTNSKAQRNQTSTITDKILQKYDITSSPTTDEREIASVFRAIDVTTSKEENDLRGYPQEAAEAGLEQQFDRVVKMEDSTVGNQFTNEHQQEEIAEDRDFLTKICNTKSKSQCELEQNIEEMMIFGQTNQRQDVPVQISLISQSLLPQCTPPSYQKVKKTQTFTGSFCLYSSHSQLIQEKTTQYDKPTQELTDFPLEKPIVAVTSNQPIVKTEAVNPAEYAFQSIEHLKKEEPNSKAEESNEVQGQQMMEEEDTLPPLFVPEQDIWVQKPTIPDNYVAPKSYHTNPSTCYHLIRRWPVYRPQLFHLLPSQRKIHKQIGVRKLNIEGRGPNHQSEPLFSSIKDMFR